MLPPSAGSVPAIHRAVVPNAFSRDMQAWKEVGSSREHEALRNNLAELVYLGRRDLLAPPVSVSAGHSSLFPHQTGFLPRSAGIFIYWIHLSVVWPLFPAIAFILCALLCT